MAGYPYARRRGAPKFIAAIAAFVVSGAAYVADTGTVEAACDGKRTITANVVVLDNPTVFNRLGAQNPNWITYALRRDVIDVRTGTPEGIADANGVVGVLEAGFVELRPDKRPRPLVVRSAAGDCLTVNFQNLLDPVANPNNAIQDLLINNDQVADRCASFHAQGVELVGGMNSDGSYVGNNNPGEDPFAVCGAGAQKAGLVGPGGNITYTLYTPHEGTFTINSYGATIGGEQSSGNLGIGMFGQLNVEPKDALIYRGQLTEEEMRLAATDPVTGLVRTVASDCVDGDVVGVDCNPGGQPIIDYEALYPAVEPWISEGKAGLPIINMLTAGNELVHSDINAIIAGTGPNGTFDPSTYPLESKGFNVPNLPNRLEPFREFASVFHDEQTNSQVFPRWYGNAVLQYTLAGVKDQFMINYGSGGIGSEIIANRLHTGPMHDCTDCAYEEFFLASQTVGDPGMLVEKPANTMIEQCDPAAIAGPSCWRDPINLANGPIPGNFALYQEDPSNVHHAYTGDFVKIRNIHAGAFEQHIFHLHNHQWLFNPNDDNANYLDAQEIMPGSGHSYELVNGGAGNRNKTAGDAIFHCHFYPHFAQGMWYHIRNHDVMETGTVLAVSAADDPQNPTTGFHTAPFGLRSGEPALGARALPDGELLAGTPIPAIVPLPGKAMPQMPARVSVTAVDRGDFGLLAGRTPPNGLGQGADSSQTLVDRASAAGADGVLGTADDVSPGFPFWLAGNECGPDGAAGVCPQGIVGQRMPTPVLDMLTEAGATANNYAPAQAGGWDGGLPRHALLGYTAGGLSLDTQNRLDFSKVIERAQPVYFPEIGTDMEEVSMSYHAVRMRPSAANNLADTGITEADFVTNGLPPVPGGPFQDPCGDDEGNALLAGVTGNYFDGQGGMGTQGSSAFSSESPRTYKVANIQIDAVFNKVGYHYPQERIIALWEDVAPTIAKQRPPEPLVMRYNTFDCGKLLHTNLVPAEYELDDFQVRTPTDIIGQHIHLPKWDLTTNDGAANGWNYEDGALSPGIVQERIHAINLFNEEVEAEIANPGAHPDLAGLAPVLTIDTGDPGGTPETGDTGSSVVARRHGAHRIAASVLRHGQMGDEYLGARTVIQRLFVDPIVNVAGMDRGLGLTFSHDHYGPSTFQQIGLYSTILIEPAGSTWVHNETGEPLSTGREDGGPTSWQAVILPPDAPVGTVQSDTIPDHREFYFEFGDFQHAYEAGVYVGADENGRPIRTNIVSNDPFNVTEADAPALNNTWQRTVNPPLKLKSVPFPDVVTAEGACPGPLGNADPAIPRPCAEAINISHSSMLVVNYRNEPVGLRVFDPQRRGPDGNRGTQANGLAGDLAFALQTRTDRAIPQLNTAFGDMPYPTPSGCDINCDRQAGDPITPIMRAYQTDEIKVKIQSGATEEQHQVSIHGMKWLSNGSGFGKSGNSGWRNFQSDGISEQFSLQAPVNPDLGQAGQRAFDTLYATDVSRDGIWSGVWGILRTYGFEQNNLTELPDNPIQNRPNQNTVVNEGDFNGVCPLAANVVTYDVSAVLANDVLPNDIVLANGQVGVTIPDNGPVQGRNDNEGGPLNPDGGTLVHNRRGTVVPDVVVPPEPPEPGGVLQGGSGPLNDPTAIMYVRTDELVPNPQNQQQQNRCNQGGAQNPDCPVLLADNAPVEPLVLRANAGDCIEVTLRNRLPDVAPDLAGWQDLQWVVNRDLFNNVRPPQMHFFNNNLVRPSSYVGLHPQLVEYDVTRDDGTLVGSAELENLAPPGGQTTYRWYAGDVAYVDQGNNTFEIVATPIEFGAVNLLSADRVKQPQKGLFGSLVIEPAGATYPDTLAELVAADERVPDGQGSGVATRLTRANVTVTSPAGNAGSGGTYREALMMNHRINNIRWADGSAVANIHQGELGREGAEDSGHAGLNYGMEPSWFRFKLPPDVPFGNAGTPNSFGSIENAHAMYANALVKDEPNAVPAIAGVSAEGDPATPVFMATAEGLANPVSDTRMHMLNGASTDRDGTFMLHGHLWQRDPFVCTDTVTNVTGTTATVQDPQDGQVALAGRCAPNAAVPSMALGLNPQAKYLGGEEGMGHSYGHWPILFDAGGTDGITGDYLYRDYSPSGNRNGVFGLLRVQ